MHIKPSHIINFNITLISLLVDSPVVVIGWDDLPGTARHGLVDEGSHTCPLTLQGLQHLTHLTSIQFTSCLCITVLPTVHVRQRHLKYLKKSIELMIKAVVS